MTRLVQNARSYKYLHIISFVPLAILWAPMAFFGFHPFHEGFMLATLNLTTEAIKTGDPLPFNQYGPFWALPYLAMELLPLGGFTFLAQRIISIIIIFLSAIVIRRLSLEFHSRKTSLMIAWLFLLIYPFGQPSIIWPSIPAQFALLALVWSVLRSLRSTTTFHTLIASFLTIFLLGSRIQIGILSLICTIMIFIIAKNFKVLAHYSLYTITILGLFISTFRHLGLLQNTVFDSLVFPFTYLDPNVGALTLPRTSIAITIALFFLFFSLRQIRRLKTLASVLLVLFGIVFFSLIILSLSSQVTYLKVYARIYVGFFLFIVISILLLILQSLRQSEHRFALKELSLYLYSLVGAAQIVPLFDVFHAWYASAPLIIALPLILKEKNVLAILPIRSIWVWAGSLVLVSGTLFGIQALQGFSNNVKHFPLDEVKGIYLSPQQASDLEKQFTYFKSNIPKGARVLNLCSHADPFFPRKYWSSESRFFVYWQAFSRFNLLEQELRKADYVINCTSLDSLSYESRQLLQNDFSEIENGQEVFSWGRRWEIYRRVQEVSD